MDVWAIGTDGAITSGEGGGGVTILRGEKTVDKGKILSATINRILSGNITSPILTADKGRVLSGSINRNLEGSVCRI